MSLISEDSLRKTSQANLERLARSLNLPIDCDHEELVQRVFQECNKPREHSQKYRNDYEKMWETL